MFALCIFQRFMIAHILLYVLGTTVLLSPEQFIKLVFGLLCGVLVSVNIHKPCGDSPLCKFSTPAF